MTPQQHPAAPDESTPGPGDTGRPAGDASRSRRLPRITAGVLGAALTLGSLAACSLDGGDDSGSGTGTTSTGTWGDSSVRSASDSDGTVWDSSSVHSISVDVDEDEYAAMLAAFVDSDEKEWISATVVIDGQTFTDVGLRLKGNSSLRSVSTTDTEPQDLPWLIRLDKFVDGQELDGSTGFVVRSSGTETALNEAVALELFDQAGLATQEAIATRFSVNGSAETLRLTIENPDDAWDAAEFDTEGILYKAEAEGDYSYRGDDPESYTDVFDQESGDEDNLEPLIGLLEFLESSDDETFAAELSDHLDVDAFATYLAMQDLVGNFDDIDGPGNNSYLRWDAETGAFTVVSWDLNLAFGQSPMGGMGGGMGVGRPGGAGSEGFVPPEGVELPDGAEMPELPEGVELPEGFVPGEGFPEGEMPEGMEPPTGDLPSGAARPGGAGGAMGGSNVLSTRFLENADFTALYEQASAELTESLYTSGDAEEILSTWVTVLTEQAGDLVDATTLETEADAVRAGFTADDAEATEPAAG